jgi:chain length determinant protein EpsF
MEFLQIVGMVRDRWWIVALGLLIGLAGGAIAYKTTDKQYKATTTVVVDVKTPDPVAGIVQGAASSNYMSTQVEIIRSDRVAQRVVHALKLDQSAALINRWRDEAGSGMAFSLWLGKLLDRGLEVLPARDSNVIAISFYAVDPEFAKNLSSAFAQAYIEVTVDMKVEPARQYAALFDEQAKMARERVEAAQSRLHDYERAKGVIASSDRLEIETAKLNELQSSLVSAEAQSVETKSRSDNAGDTSPDVMQSGIVQGLRSEIDRSEAKLAELSAKVGRSNPSYIRAQAELSTLKDRLAQETRTVTTSVHTTGQVNAGKTAGLRAALDAQRERIFETRKKMGDFGVLKQEVEAAQKFYDAVAQRYTQSTLESRANQTNIYLLSPASKPLEAVAPKLNKMIGTGIALGLALGLGIAGLIEMTQRRIRAIGELTENLGLNFLGELSAPPRTGWLGRLARRFSRAPHPLAPL